MGEEKVSFINYLFFVVIYVEDIRTRTIISELLAKYVSCE